MVMSDNDSDRALVERALCGDKAAFGGLVERHRPMAVRLASRMLSDSAEADDVAQEACLHAFLTLNRLRDPERFGAWLYGIVVNLCRLRLRLRARRTVYTLEDWDGGRVAAGFQWSEIELSPEAAYEIRELHALILRAIELLPDEQRVASGGDRRAVRLAAGYRQGPPAPGAGKTSGGAGLPVHLSDAKGDQANDRGHSQRSDHARGQAQRRD
jgi:RNA polymerase sigma-70 factor (ECF subfamily)